MLIRKASGILEDYAAQLLIQICVCGSSNYCKAGNSEFDNSGLLSLLQNTQYLQNCKGLELRIAESLMLSVRAIWRYPEYVAAALVVLATINSQVLQVLDSCMNEMWDEKVMLDHANSLFFIAVLGFRVFCEFGIAI